MMSTKDVILSVIRDHPGITEDEIRVDSRIAAVPANGVRPGRMRLWLAGAIEPDSEAGWEAVLNNRVKHVRWRVVEDARRAEVAARAATRTERNAPDTAEQQAIRIVEGMRDPVVKRLVDELMKEGAGSRRAQTRGAQTLRAMEIARKREAAEAAREQKANADFKRNLARLWEARGAVGAIDEHLIRERARVSRGIPRKISDLDWILALNDVRTIIKSFGGMWQNLRDLGGQNEPCPACGAVPASPTRALGAFIIEADAIETEPLAEEEIASAEVLDH